MQRKVVAKQRRSKMASKEKLSKEEANILAGFESDIINVIHGEYGTQYHNKKVDACRLRAAKKIREFLEAERKELLDKILMKVDIKFDTILGEVETEIKNGK